MFLGNRLSRSWRETVWFLHVLLVGGFNSFENISQIGSFPQEGVKIKNVWNHHLVYRSTTHTSQASVSGKGYEVRGCCSAKWYWFARCFTIPYGGSVAICFKYHSVIFGHIKSFFVDMICLDHLDLQGVTKWQTKKQKCHFYMFDWQHWRNAHNPIKGVPPEFLQTSGSKLHAKVLYIFLSQWWHCADWMHGHFFHDPFITLSPDTWHWTTSASNTRCPTRRRENNLKCANVILMDCGTGKGIVYITPPAPATTTTTARHFFFWSELTLINSTTSINSSTCPGYGNSVMVLSLP